MTSAARRAAEPHAEHARASVWHYCTMKTPFVFSPSEVRVRNHTHSHTHVFTLQMVELMHPMLFAASLLLAVARSSVPACPTPRNVYIDAGVNWCNSLLIFKSVPEAKARLAEPWHIFGFEANKRIAPFANLCHRALSAGQPLPTPPIPPAGSTRDLARYAARYNCSKVQLGLRPASSTTERCISASC